MKRAYRKLCRTISESSRQQHSGVLLVAGGVLLLFLLAPLLPAVPSLLGLFLLVLGPVGMFTCGGVLLFSAAPAEEGARASR